MANFIVKESNKINGSTKINNADELITNNMLDTQHWLNNTDGTLDGGQDWSSGGFQADIANVSGLQGELDAKQPMLTGLTASVTELNYTDGVTSNIQEQLSDKASSSHNHSGVYQPAGTYNTTIGTDTDITTSGATIVDNIYVTDGVITSMGTRTLLASDILDFSSGSYTPVLVSGYTLNNALYTRVGDVVNVTISFSHTGGTQTSSSTFNVPFSSNFTSESDCTGSGFGAYFYNGEFRFIPVEITADTATNTIRISFTNQYLQGWNGTVNFKYIIK